MLNSLNAQRLPRPSVRIAAALVLISACLPSEARPQASTQAPPRDKAYWQAVVKNEFKVPTDVPLLILVGELHGLLGSPDPELRDDIAYSVLANWIYRQRIVPEEERLRLLRAWEADLKAGIGERNTDTVVRRSFSVLALGVLVILDNEAAYIDRETFTRVLTSALGYMRDEQDVRGFDARLGWLHSVAHTADLLKFLARSRHLAAAEQAQMLGAIEAKLRAVEIPLVHGEDERLARAVLSITSRPDFDEAGFVAWLKAMSPVRRTTPPTPATLAVDQNRKNLLVSLFAVLSTDRRDLEGNTRARALVLDALRAYGAQGL
jgi:hypothetical protein